MDTNVYVTIEYNTLKPYIQTGGHRSAIRRCLSKQLDWIKHGIVPSHVL